MRTARLDVELLSVVSFGALAVAIVAAEPLVQLVFGAEFVDAAPALPVLRRRVHPDLLRLPERQPAAGARQTEQAAADQPRRARRQPGRQRSSSIPLVGFMGAAWMTLLTEAVVFFFRRPGCVSARARDPRSPAVGRVARTAARRGRARACCSAAMKLADAPLVALARRGLRALPGAAVRAAGGRSRGRPGAARAASASPEERISAARARRSARHQGRRPGDARRSVPRSALARRAAERLAAEPLVGEQRAAAPRASGAGSPRGSTSTPARPSSSSSGIAADARRDAPACRRPSPRAAPTGWCRRGWAGTAGRPAGSRSSSSGSRRVAGGGRVTPSGGRHVRRA